MAALSMADIRHTLFTKEPDNPDDLVECPFVRSHVLKRKRLPIHVPDCRETNGQGFLQCSFSMLHYFRTEAELTKHEVLCPMRRQVEGSMRVAPSYHAHQVADPLALSPMARLLMQRRAQRAAMDEAAEKEALKESASSDGAPAIEEPTLAKMYRGTEAQIKERTFLSELCQTVLFSQSRIPQILSGSVEESTSVNRWAPDLAVVEEESEDTPEVPARQLEPPVVPCRAYEAYLEQRKQDEVRNDRPKSLRIRITDSIGMACNNRFEDDRDARSQPVDFFVDWHIYPKRYQGALKAKWARDNEIYKTRKNPRYQKSIDRPGSAFPGRAPRSNPFEFEEQAAWFEDLVWKPLPLAVTEARKNAAA